VYFYFYDEEHFVFISKKIEMLFDDILEYSARNEQSRTTSE